MSLPCGHEWRSPPVAGCAFCAIRHVPFHMKRWGGFPPPPCVHLGEPTGEVVACQTCAGTVKIKSFACAIYGTCTLAKRLTDVPGCCDSKCEHKTLREELNAR